MSTSGVFRFFPTFRDVFISLPQPTKFSVRTIVSRATIATRPFSPATRFSGETLKISAFGEEKVNARLQVSWRTVSNGGLAGGWWLTGWLAALRRPGF